MRKLAMLLAALTLAAAGCGGGENTSANQSTEPDVTTGTGATTGGGEGDPQAGQLIWVTEGCNNCHKLAGNPATSIPGPNFDEHPPDRKTIIEVTKNGKGSMPGFGDSLSQEDLDNVAAYIAEASGT